METPKNLNRIKAAFADAGNTSKWLAEQLGKDLVTINGAQIQHNHLWRH